jgi:hypothetical protein
MKTNKTTLGLSILAGGLSFVGAANGMDLIIDGSYESATNNYVSTSPPIGLGGTYGAGIDAGWTPFTTYSYSSGYTQTGPAGSGAVYLRPYNDSGGSQTVSQTVSLTRAITPGQIDASNGQFTLSAWFSTYKNQNDYSDLTLEFLDQYQSPVGSPVNIGGAAFVAGLPPASPMRPWGQDTKSGLIPPGARYATITTVSHALVNLPDGYVDLVSLDVVAGYVPVQISAASPADHAVGVSPAAGLSVTFQDGTAPLNTNSVALTFDGNPATPAISKAGSTTSLQFTPAGLLPALSAHTYAVAFNNTGGATANTTNQYSFSVAPYVNVDLGPPIYLETFDEVAEGALPDGWSVVNFTDPDLPGLDLNNFHSDSYLDWVLISRSTLSNLFAVVPGGTDFLETVNVAPNQVINNALVTNLIDGNFMFAVSDRDDYQKQIQYLFTKDYNLSGHNNVYVSFHNIYTQNQDSMGSVEYSIDGGTTWLPALYLLDGADILRDAQGNIDAWSTFATAHGDVPDLDGGTLSNGHYGRYIGVASNQWAGLGPFLSARVDDDQTSSKRVEVVRLAQADNQPAVRLRFAQVGTWSWYFGIDDLGLYSIAGPAAPLLTGPPTPATQTVAVGNLATLTIPAALGLGPITYQWRQNGTNLPGRTSAVLTIPAVQFANAGTYDVVVSNAGGSVTSPPPAAVLTVFNPVVLVTGQWDFNGGLAATYGSDLAYFDSTVQGDTSFGTTTSFGLPDINGQPATVMHFYPSIAQWGGYKAFHGAAPNGGGAYVNQYTLIYDLYYPGWVDNTWRSLLQTDLTDNNDGDAFISNADGLGISSVYDGYVSPDAWHRIAIAFDLSGPGRAPVLTKFIDGVKVGEQTSGLSGPDGRFSLDPAVLLFADNDGDQNETYVSSVQFSNGRRPDGFIEALGGPSAKKIPGVIKASPQGTQVVITWTGGVPLQSAASLAGPWGTVTGATSPYTVPSLDSGKFYRPKIP